MREFIIEREIRGIGDSTPGLIREHAEHAASRPTGSPR